MEVNTFLCTQKSALLLIKLKKHLLIIYSKCFLMVNLILPDGIHLFGSNYHVTKYLIFLVRLPVEYL